MALWTNLLYQMPARLQENIGRLEVSMNHTIETSVVHHAEPPDNVFCDPESLLSVGPQLCLVLLNAVEWAALTLEQPSIQRGVVELQ